MGGSTETTKTFDQTTNKNPWGPSAGLLSGLLGKLGGVNTDLTGAENAAFRGLMGNAGFLPQWGGHLSNIANQFLSGGRTGMVQQGLDELRTNLNPTISGQYLDPASNPFMAGIGNRTKSMVDAMYAGAGRDPAGAGSYGGNLTQALTDAYGPIYQQERQNQVNAINALFGGSQAAGGLLSQLDAANLAGGTEAARMAQGFMNDPYNQMLAIEAQRRGIPLQALAQVAGIGLPIGQAFGTQNTTGTETTQQEQPFNPWSLAPLAFLPMGGGMSLGGNLLGGLGSGLFGGRSNNFLGGGNWLKF